MPKFALFLTFFLFNLFAVAGLAQDLSGQWEGMVQQDDKKHEFTYWIDLEFDGKAVSGIAISTNDQLKLKAKFTLSGVYQDNKLLLQEVQQLDPSEPQWCLKFLTLVPKLTDSTILLSGDWRAKGCNTGTIGLTKKRTSQIIQKKVPFEMNGLWSGYLTQDDREYGFFYEVELEDNGKGVSSIVSEGSGGIARHDLTWQFAKNNSVVELTESRVKSKTVEDWKWCIKSTTLNLKKHPEKYTLDGNWIGFIEGKNQTTGACAPGRIHLEKPILNETMVKTITPETNTYQKEKHRKVKIGQILTVKNPTIRMKVWDNGTVDGDVVTLFLNGERILHNYRVSKRKWTRVIDLKKENNLLILHAEDLGAIIPNTVAVSIHDGTKEEIIILSSNLDVSGAILIRQFDL